MVRGLKNKKVNVKQSEFLLMRLALTNVGLSDELARHLVNELSVVFVERVAHEITAIAAGDAMCAICGCTEDRCCPGGCRWANDPEDPARDRCDRCVGKQHVAQQLEVASHG